ncbi:MAG: collagen-binding domain-containing protein, partial [Anaerocolumna sp.]
MNNENYNSDMPMYGIPYDDVTWYDVDGNPFGSASNFNVIVFGDANNIVDVEGAMAIGGGFYSPRGLSVGFERSNGDTNVTYSPEAIRFMAQGNVSVSGPLVVIGHAVGGSNFRVAKGSTYLIGKDNTNDQMEELSYLYQANGGSQYWTPSDKGNHYLIPSYDVPRFIPASRIGADVGAFFRDGKNSITEFKNCIQDLEVNGTIVDNYHELILRGNDPVQNVFLVDLRPNGVLTKGLRAEVPQGSLVIIRLRTGNNAHLQYGLMGEKSKANRTLYVFEDATNIYMEVPADIWGSILAPQAMFHGHPTGGHVSGNAALRSFAVSPTSGFEFHLYPFVGGVVCGEEPEVPTPEQPVPQPIPIPILEPMPAPVPPPRPVPPQPTPPPRPVPPQPTPPPRPVQPQPTPPPRPVPPQPTPPPRPVPPQPTQPPSPVQPQTTPPPRPVPPHPTPQQIPEQPHHTQPPCTEQPPHTPPPSAQ